MLESNYSPNSAHNPRFLFDSKAFQDMLAKIDDRAIVARWYEWALGDSDKRVALEAGKQILELKNRFPKEKIDIELSRKREDLFQDEDTGQTITSPPGLESDTTPAGDSGEVSK